MSRPIQKTVYTLNIDNYAPEICELTYPLIRAYAKKIGAEFRFINSRKFDGWPVTYEKLQLYQLARQHGNEWSIYVDSDTLISPEMFDPTEQLSKDTVCHNGRDMAGIRWRYDEYFRRDGRNVGSCNWFAVASDWCLDLWRPLEDLTPDQAIANINVTIGEHNGGITAEHLVDDYALSRNIARFGLKFTTITDICAGFGWKTPDGRGVSSHLWHKYNMPHEEKVREMLAILSTPNGTPAFTEQGQMGSDAGGRPVMKTADGRIIEMAGIGWGLMDAQRVAEYKKKWGVR